MRKSLFIAAAIFVAMQLQAQKSFKRNTLYGEIAGNGLILSVNYEKQLGNKPGLGLHFGVGLAGDKPSFPFGAKYLFQLGKERSFLEIGAGVTLMEREIWDQNWINVGRDKKNSYGPGFIPSIGYRYHAPKGFMWRINYAPVFNKYRTEAVYFGVSVGWRI